MTGVAEEDLFAVTMNVEGMADEALSRDSLLDNTPAQVGSVIVIDGCERGWGEKSAVLGQDFG